MQKMHPTNSMRYERGTTRNMMTTPRSQLRVKYMTVRQRNSAVDHKKLDTVQLRSEKPPAVLASLTKTENITVVAQTTMRARTPYA